jgi:arsenite transporter
MELICVAVGLLVMMYPILCRVRYETLHRVFGEREIWVQIGFSIVVNWIVAPLVMVCMLMRGQKPLLFFELICYSLASCGNIFLTNLACEKA